jgi:hypothetical protein
MPDISQSGETSGIETVFLLASFAGSEGTLAV